MKGKHLAVALILLLSIVATSAAYAQRLTIGWTNFGPSMEVSFVRDDLIPKFTAETGIAVDFVSITGPELMQGFAAGQGPDVLLTFRDLGLSQTWHDFLMPLDPFLDRWEESRFIPEWLLRRSHIDHHVYALPIHNNLYGVYAYNKEVFAESGLDPSSPPQSWQELLEVVQRTTRTDRAGLDMVQWTAEQTFVSYLYQNDGKMWTGDFNQILFHQHEGIEALEFMADLYQESHLHDDGRPSRVSQRINHTQLATSLANGNLAMLKSYSSSLAEYSDLEQIGYFVGQRSPSHEPIVIAEPYGLAISKFAVNPIDAWDFIEWFLQPENTIQFHQITNTLATRLDLAEWVEQYTPHFRHLYEYTSHAILQPRLETLPFSWFTYDSDWQMVLNGQMDAETALVNAGSILQQQLDDILTD